MTTMNERKNTPATLLGQGIGDALGCPFEVPNEASLYHPGLADWKGEFRSTRGGWHDLEPGQWSDDTQFAVALAEALLDGIDNLARCGMRDRRQIGELVVRSVSDLRLLVAGKYVALLKSGIRGAGGTCKRALEALAVGVSPNESGVEGAEGNGTAMRAAPVGLLLRGASIHDVMEVARVDARLTHRSREAEEGSAAVAGMVAVLAAGDRVRVGRALEQVVLVLHDSEVRNRLKRLLACDSHTVKLDDLLVRFGTRGRVTSTVPSAFACFMLTDSYEEAVVAAVRGGGDADTTAAITGALAGTYYGYEGIPARLRVDVERADMLCALDDRLWEAGRARDEKETR